MNFTLPTTKSEMYSTLKEIYLYYRIHAATYIAEERPEFSLDRMEFTPLTDEELTEKAESLIEGAFLRERKEKEDVINDKIEALNGKKTVLTEEYEKIFLSVEKKYSEIKEKIKDEACKKGLTFSSIVTEKTYQAEKEKANELLKYQNEKSEKLSKIDGEIDSLEDKLDELSDFYDNLKEVDINAKFIELKEAQEKTLMEVFKYNNGIEEKELRFKNANLTNDMTLEVRYLEAKSKGLTKEYLVDAGYYKDVIDCIAGYYNRLSAVNAYNDIKNETGLIEYLEDFYQDVIYGYRVKALD